MTDARATCREREIALYNALARALVFLGKNTPEAEDARQELIANVRARENEVPGPRIEHD